MPGPHPKATSFRQLCRNIVLTDEVQTLISERAQTDADYALRVAEHGFGRPPQALAVDVQSSVRQDITYTVSIEGGYTLSPAAAGLPAAGAPVNGGR